MVLSSIWIVMNHKRGVGISTGSRHSFVLKPPRTRAGRDVRGARDRDTRRDSPTTCAQYVLAASVEIPKSCDRPPFVLIDILLPVYNHAAGARLQLCERRSAHWRQIRVDLFNIKHTCVHGRGGLRRVRQATLRELLHH